MILSTWTLNPNIRETIQEHPLLEWLKIVDWEDDIKLIDSQWTELKPLEFNLTYNQDKDTKPNIAPPFDISAIKSEIASRKADFSIIRAWFQWINGVYTSMHWEHKVNILVPFNLWLDAKKAYHTDSSNHLNKTSINAIWKFGDNCILVSDSRQFGTDWMTWYSDWVTVIALNSSTKEVLQSRVASNEPLNGDRFKIFNYKWSLILLRSQYEIDTSKSNLLHVLVDSKWNPSGELFKWWMTEISEGPIRNHQHSSYKKITNLLEQ